MAQSELSPAQQANLSLGQRFAELYETGSLWAPLDHFDEFCHPDLELRPAIVELGDKVFRGREGFREWIAGIDAVASEHMIEAIEIEAVGEDHLMALGKMRMVGRESGVAVESEYGMLGRIEGGRFIEITAFLAHAEAKLAAEKALADEGAEG